MRRDDERRALKKVGGYPELLRLGDPLYQLQGAQSTQRLTSKCAVAPESCRQPIAGSTRPRRNGLPQCLGPAGGDAAAVELTRPLEAVFNHRFVQRRVAP